VGGEAAVGASAERSEARFNPSRPPPIDRPPAGLPEYLLKSIIELVTSALAGWLTGTSLHPA
jgi:hypothetical protein